MIIDDFGVARQVKEGNVKHLKKTSQILKISFLFIE